MADPDAAREIGRLDLHEEVLRLGIRRRVSGRLRVAVTTAEQPESVTATRRSRLVEIERVRLDREVDQPPPVRQEGTTVIVPVLEERLVLVRRLVVTEEIRFRLAEREEEVTLSAPRRVQEVEVTRLPVDADDTDDTDFIDQGESLTMQRTITAMFDTRAEAERAAEALRGLGIGASDVRVHAAETGSSGTTGTASSTQDRGLFASIADLFVPDDDRATYSEGMRRGATLVSAQVEERNMHAAMDALEAAGAVDLDEREANWRSEGWSGSAGSAAMGGSPMGGSMSGSGATGAVLGASSSTSATGVAAMPVQGSSNPPGTMASRGVDQVAGTNISGAHPEHETGRAGMAAATGRDEAIQLAEERLRIGKREAHAGRVRVRSYVVETPVEEQVRLREERVHVERHAVDRAVTGSEADLFRERVIEAEERIEEPVVQKEVRVTGEVVVNRQVEERTETIRDTVRRTEVEVDEDNIANDATRRGSKGVA